jgi:hypothetical protein
MNTIRHDSVPPKCDIKLADRAMTVSRNSILSGIQQKNTFAVAGGKSDEVEWLITVNQIKSMRPILDHWFQCRGSRESVRGCNDSRYAGDTPAATEIFPGWQEELAGIAAAIRGVLGNFVDSLMVFFKTRVIKRI